MLIFGRLRNCGYTLANRSDALLPFDLRDFFIVEDEEEKLVEVEETCFRGFRFSLVPEGPLGLECVAVAKKNKIQQC